MNLTIELSDEKAAALKARQCLASAIKRTCSYPLDRVVAAVNAATPGSYAEADIPYE
jgi:hypothetical protein